MNPKLKAALILLVVFALGAMAGYVFVKQSGDRPAISRGLDPFRMEPGVVERIERRLTEHYKLTADQQLAVRKILMDSQKRYDDFFHETRPTFDKIRRDQRDAIRKLMTPEQTVKFDKWMEEHRRHGPGKPGDRRPKGSPPPEGAPENSPAGK